MEVPRGGQLLKTRAPEPPAGRFPKFLLPRAAGRPQKLKCTKGIQSPMLVRVVGREWNSGVPGGTKIFRRPHIGFAGPLVKYWRQGRRNNLTCVFCFFLGVHTNHAADCIARSLTQHYKTQHMSAQLSVCIRDLNCESRSARAEHA